MERSLNKQYVNGDPEWWRRAVVYQIYPRSFQDSNGDGIGDLRGIIQRIPYLVDLGVDAVWLSPFYPSPMKDFGYDVADYCGVDPMFGSLEDFDQMLSEFHRNQVRVIVDLVPNHSSDEHVWFQESASSRESSKRDWYIWRDASTDGGPPNNWSSFFGGPAWSWHEPTGQFYMHQFHSGQPELNYRNPDVVEAMKAAMRFWLDRGVDGFRTDVAWTLLKDEQFRDEPLNSDWDGVDPHGRLEHIYTQDVPGIHDLMKVFRSVVDEYDEKVFIGEIYLPDEKLVSYYGDADDEFHLPFNFSLVSNPDWSAASVRTLVEDYLSSLPVGACQNWVLNNHDRVRLATRAGEDQVKVSALLLLSLGGCTTLYYGEEIGMPNGDIPVDKIQDPWALQVPDKAHIFGRDPVRTPMHWDQSPSAGFSEGEAWLPVQSNLSRVSVEAQRGSADSALEFYRTLMEYRRRNPAFVDSKASFDGFDRDEDSDLLVFRKFGDTGPEAEQKWLVILNMSSKSHVFQGSESFEAQVVACASGRYCENQRLDLNSEMQIQPNEALLLELV